VDFLTRKAGHAPLLGITAEMSGNVGMALNNSDNNLPIVRRS